MVVWVSTHIKVEDNLLPCQISRLLCSLVSIVFWGDQIPRLLCSHVSIVLWGDQIPRLLCSHVSIVFWGDQIPRLLCSLVSIVFWGDIFSYPISYLYRDMGPSFIIKHYLSGHNFTLETDHDLLTWLYRMKEKNQRLIRWSLTLQQYDFEIKYRRGDKNANADALSRQS
jgi:hypothetical protein